MQNGTFTETSWSPQRTSRWLELALANANVVASGWLVWTILSAPRSAPPRGGQSWMISMTNAYLLEVVVLGVLVLLALLGELRQGAPRLRLLWGCLGALAGLSGLAVWSIGAALIPSLVLVFAAGSLAAVRARARLSQVLGWFLVGMGCQVALMLLVITLALAGAPRP